jgi:hypothetical protein
VIKNRKTNDLLNILCMSIDIYIKRKAKENTVANFHNGIDISCNNAEAKTFAYKNI